MDRLLGFIFFLFIIVESHSQQPGEDKIAYADSLLELSYQGYAQMDLNSSLTYAQKVLSLSKEIDYSKGKAKGNFYIAQVLGSLGEYEKTIEYLQLAEDEPYVANDLILISEICRVKGRTYGSLQLYDLSVREFQKGLRYINRIKTPFERQYLTSLAYENLSHIYSLQNITDSVLHYLNKNEQLLNSMEEKQVFRSLINLYAQLGRAHASRKEYDLATECFAEALKLSEVNNYPYTSCVYLQWGNMMNKQGLPDSAIVKYRAGLNNLKQTKLRSELPDIYAALRDIYILKGNSDSALVYQQKKTAIESELAEVNHRALDKAVQILLKEEKGNQTFQLNRARSTALAIIALIGLLAFGVWLHWRKRYQRAAKKEQELLEAMKESRDSMMDELVELVRKNDSSFLPRFMELFPRFTQHIYQRHPDLSQSSFLFCAYIFLHFSSKEIAECMYIEHKSVQTRKNRLRKQMELPRNTDLYQYMRWLDEPEGASGKSPI